jgi:hypothetical protein
MPGLGTRRLAGRLVKAALGFADGLASSFSDGSTRDLQKIIDYIYRRGACAPQTRMTAR